MKKIALGLIAVIFFAACESKDGNQVTVSGTIENPPEEGMMTISLLEQGKLSLKDTIVLNEDNTFEYTMPAGAPEFYILNMFNTQRATLILSEEDVEVIADGSERNGKLEITGSEDIKHLEAIRNMTEEQNEEVREINAQFLAARKADDQEKMKNIQDDFMIIQEKRKENIKAKVEEMLPSIAVIQAMNFFNPNEDFEFMQKVSASLEEAHPNSSIVQFYAKQIDDLSKVSIGVVAPDFSMPTPEGDTVSLSDYRGGYVLVDFWAAWCKPCRAENPNVVAAYNKYKDQGFEILGVSLDKKREDWLKAIEQDGLEWTQVSDLKYWQTPVVQEYKISGIPFSLLIGPEGKIVAKNLRGDELHQKLEEIYSGS
ncbi:TlpA disulfide reductase family protein [Marivirga atlantica]|jgi:peroxiredoxin|uniref:AhpC/TSA family protein n=1 Tax=Marivirga atlantica TaxID=1548457 RepID=A0A937A9L0_9BACT|nr:TlpA disulfide reductase family protein [Marivirga atlantica]MBL0764846.1 AhpC/TSA family protein [Marivirga atlantica]